MMQTPESVLTQEQVAKQLGITKSAVYQYERNAFRKIRRALELDAAANGISIRELINEWMEP